MGSNPFLSLSKILLDARLFFGLLSPLLSLGLLPSRGCWIVGVAAIGGEVRMPSEVFDGVSWFIDKGWKSGGGEVMMESEEFEVDKKEVVVAIGAAAGATRGTTLFSSVLFSAMRSVPSLRQSLAS